MTAGAVHLPPPAVHAALEAARTSAGPTLAEISRRGPVLLVFLRHFG